MTGPGTTPAPDDQDRRWFEFALAAYTESRTHLRHIESERRFLFAAIFAASAATVFFVAQVEGAARPSGSARQYAAWAGVLLTLFSVLGLLSSLRDVGVQWLLEKRSRVVGDAVGDRLGSPEIARWLRRSTEDVDPVTESLSFRVFALGMNRFLRRRFIFVLFYLVTLAFSLAYTVSRLRFLL